MLPEDSRASPHPADDGPAPRDEGETGLSRSIRSLFDASPEPASAPSLDAGAPDPQGSDEPSEEGATATEPRSPSRARFATNVARYLEAGSVERDRLVPEILEDGRALRRSEAMPAVAEAALSLALAAADAGDEPALALAGELLDTGVATHLALRLTREADPDRRERIVQAAAILPAHLAPAFADALSEASERGARRALMDALRALGDAGRDAVVGLLDDPRWFAVRNGVTLLGELGDEGTVHALTVPLAHDDPRVRRETITALAKIGGEDAGLLLVGMLDDSDPDVRAGAAMGAGILGVERAQRPLLERLAAEEKEEVQVQVLRALGLLGDPGAVSLIEKRATGSLFSRPPRAVRIAAYRALAQIGTPHARSVLEAAAKDRDEAIRTAIRSILRDPGGGAGSGPMSGEAGEELEPSSPDGATDPPAEDASEADASPRP